MLNALSIVRADDQHHADAQVEYLIHFGLIDFAQGCIQPNTAGTGQLPRRIITRTFCGTMAARFSCSPPPVMWAMPCTTFLTR